MRHGGKQQQKRWRPLSLRQQHGHWAVGRGGRNIADCPAASPETGTGWSLGEGEETLEYGLASKPISGLNQDAVWKGMLLAMRNPADCGLKVDQVSISDKIGYMQRSMRILGSQALRQ